MCCYKMWGLVGFVVLFIIVEILAEAAFFPASKLEILPA